MKKRHFISSMIIASLAMSAVPFTSAMAAETASNISGDINADRSFGIADVVLMQKWLLGTPGTEITDWKAGDMNSDNSLDVFDLCAMKKKLLNENTSSQSETTSNSITFSGSGVALSDENGSTITESDAVSVEGQIVTITKPGEYNISGTSENGQIVVDIDKTAYPDEKVILNLNGLTLSNTTSAPIYVANVGDECVISVKKGTVNTISDGTSHTDSYTDSDGNTKSINAAIYARDDIKIKGKGTLIVNGNTADGIVSTDDIKIYNGTITVTAVDDGIFGKDSVSIGDADDKSYDGLSVSVKAENGDGIKSTNTSDEKKGYVEINGGSVTVDSHSDGIQASREVIINDGEINIHTYEGKDYAAPNTGSSFGDMPTDGSFDPGSFSFGDGNFDPSNFNFGGGSSDSGNGGFNFGNGNFDPSSFTPGNGTTRPDNGSFTPGNGGFNPGGGFSFGEGGHDLGLDFSAKGIKVGNSDAEIGGTITINGGLITIDSTDDAVHCGDTLTVNGGTIEIATCDDALHCDKYLYIKGGKINITESYEGIEAMQIYVTDGDIRVYAEDDPVNAGEKGVQNMVDVANDNCIIQIDGGVIHAFVTNVREGDGIDSNGSIVINGGEIYVEGSVSGPDSALDSDGEMLVNGGTVMAIGGLGRGELPEDSSKQCSLYWGDKSTTYQSGSVVVLLDSDGNEMISYTSEQTFQCVVVSSPDIKIGGNYTLTVDGKTVAEFTVSSALTTQGQVAESGGGFGGGGFGGGNR